MDCQVTIYTRVYNTEPFLPKCLESVINQTYKSFQHVIIDNGCTDGCTEILQRYEKNHPWVKLIRFEKNQRFIDNTKWIDTPYISVLDSDDWWEPDFLERLVSFLQENDLDLAVTGTIQYLQEQGVSQIMRKLEQPVILTQRQFAQNYPPLWTFPSTRWASIQKTSIYKDTVFTGPLNLAYGGDTVSMLQYIKQCSRIGIDHSALYHYRIRPKSVSYQYNPRRFDANIAYYEQIKDFLELHHTLDYEKQEWLKRVHLSSMGATLRLLKDAKVTENEKIAECARIAGHPLTAFALTNNCEERVAWYALMWEIVLGAMAGGALTDGESLRQTLKTLSPHCYNGVTPENGGVFARDPSLCEALRQDDADRLCQLVLELIAQKLYTRQYDLGRLLCGLLPAGSPLLGILDARFYQKYARPCALILQRERLAALEELTGLLLEDKKLYDGERLLNLYLSLAALEEQVPAFLFGKLRLAKLLLSQGQKDRSRAIADELAEMGLDNEDMAALRRELEAGA